MKIVTEKRIHRVFQVSLVIKGIFAFLEILSGFAAYFVTEAVLVTFLHNLSKVAWSPRDAVLNYLKDFAHEFSVSSHMFFVVYLVSHGAIKLWLVIGLLRLRLHYYPISMVFFALFIIYQLYRYTYTHSIYLILLTILDIFILFLTWHEYKYLKIHHRKPP